MSALVRLIGSEWHGSRVKAPTRPVPELGLKLKLKGRNFRVIAEGDELVAYYLGELADDVIDREGDMTARRYSVCERCNFDQHTCPGCGESLSHDGIHLGKGPLRGLPHGSSCVDD